MCEVGDSMEFARDEFIDVIFLVMIIQSALDTNIMENAGYVVDYIV